MKTIFHSMVCIVFLILTFQSVFANDFPVASQEIQSVSAQQNKITGKITDTKTNQPLIGVIIVYEGTTDGTVSDVNGNFSLNYSATNNKLVVSYIGYETQIIVLNGNTKLDIQMSEKTQFA